MKQRCDVLSFGGGLVLSSGNVDFADTKSQPWAESLIDATAETVLSSA